MNYLALAGYSAQQAADALPAVLDLAAAGGLDLAYASDLATDAMSALGIEATGENLTRFGDEMAKTASKANTSVGQLGEAILTVGGTAKALAGGTTELNAALGVLANRGIKGSEGGTALRNIILALSAPTDKAAKALAGLGVEAFDAEGNMRPLNEIFKDLDAALSGMSEGEKTQVLNEIFNKVDLKSAQAMLAGCGDEFTNLTTELENCDGAMSQMAETMNDTLEGDIKSLQSRLEALGNAAYDGMNAPLRELVQLGGEYVSQLTSALKEGGFEGLAAALGDVLGSAAAKVGDYLPKVIQLGISVIQNLVKGLQKNAAGIGKAMSSVAVQLGEAVFDILPELFSLGTELFLMLVNGTAEALPELAEAALTGIERFTDSLVENLPLLVSTAVRIVQTLSDTLTDPEALERLLTAGEAILSALLSALSENLPALVQAGADILVFLCEALLDPENIGALLTAAAEILITLTDAIVANIDTLLLAAEEIIRTVCSDILDPENIEKLFACGAAVLGHLISGVLQIAGKLLGFGTTMETEINNELESIDWAALGIAIVEGIASGVIGCEFKLDEYLENFGDYWLTGIKDVFNIHSPSKVMQDEVGKYLALGIGDGFTNEMQSVGEQAIRALTNWTDRLPEKGQQAVQRLADDIRSVLNILPGDVQSIGSRLVEGLWSGITGMGSWLRRQISSFADSVLSGFRSVFGIHSPSALMRDSVGKYLALGIGEGFTETMPDVGKDALRAFQPLRQDAALVSALNRQSAGISTGFTISPTSTTVNNSYQYNSVQQSAPLAESSQNTAVFYLMIDSQPVAEAVAERVDMQQGTTVTLKKRGVSL